MVFVLAVLGGVLAVFLLTVLFGAPYVPSKRSDLTVGFDQLYAINESDTLVDIGSGDGVVLDEATKRGARAIGYEINPFLVWLSSWRHRRNQRVEVKLGNYLKRDLPPETTIVYLFGESYHIKQVDKWLASQAEALGRPVYVMSYGFALPNRRPIRELQAHRLYLIAPLQPQ